MLKAESYTACKACNETMATLPKAIDRLPKVCYNIDSK